MIKKKVLIFGASGQIGRYCIRRLVKDNYKVIAVTRNKHQKAYILKTQAPIGYLDIEEADIFNEKKLILSKKSIFRLIMTPNILHLKSMFYIEKTVSKKFWRSKKVFPAM